MKGSILTNRNKNKFLVFISTIVVLIIFYSFFYKYRAEKTNNENPILAKNIELQNKKLLTNPKFEIPKGNQIYFIQNSHNSPQMTEAIIDPLDVKPNDIQKMTIKAKDSIYPISSIKAIVQTDNGNETYFLSLISGTNNDGVWESQWKVHDTHSETYRTTFIAENTIGEKSDVTLTWTDPCTPLKGNDWTLDGNCFISGVNGVDNGHLILNNPSYTLTIQSGATFVWNPGKEIRLSGGKIVISSTGQLKQTNLWMIDRDGDGYPASLTQYAQDTSPVDAQNNVIGRRRSLMTSIEFVDGDDATNTCAPTCPPSCVDGDGDLHGSGCTAGGDCDDADSRAYVGSGNYESTPRIGVGGYDFSCNGIEDKALPHNSASFSSGCFSDNIISGMGWVGGQPACGNPGYLRQCAFCQDTSCSSCFSGQEYCDRTGLTLWPRTKVYDTPMRVTCN